MSSLSSPNTQEEGDRKCDFPHNLTSLLKHNLATQGPHSYFQRKQAVNTLKDILAASLLCEA
jgi:hypothetical protein